MGKRQKHKETLHTKEPRGQPLKAGDHYVSALNDGTAKDAYMLPLMILSLVQSTSQNWT